MPIHKNKNLFYTLAKHRSNSKRQLQTWMVLAGLVCVAEPHHFKNQTLLISPIHKDQNLIHTLAKCLSQLERQLQTWLVLPRLNRIPQVVQY